VKSWQIYPGEKMLGKQLDNHQQQFLCMGLREMLNPADALYKLAEAFPWAEVEREFGSFYAAMGRPAKRIRLMVSLLLLKQMYDLSDERVVEEWVRNPYYQFFSGEQVFQWKFPCEPSDLVHFRKRLGDKGIQKLFQYSVELHGKAAEEKVVIADTTVQEKNITFPTDVKLYRKVVEYCWRVADQEGLALRQRYTRVVRKLLIRQRFRKHRKQYQQAMRAERRLRTVAGCLLREIIRKVPEKRFGLYAAQIEVCDQILSQRKKDQNKIYSLHEPEVYCVAKGKEHKAYEFGSKVSLLWTKRSGIIVGAISLRENEYDGHTVEAALKQYEGMHADCKSSEQEDWELTEIIADRGYRGPRQYGNTLITIPRPLEKGRSPYEVRKIRDKFRRRAGIEPVIGHLKSDYGLDRNFLKGLVGDQLNVMLSAAAFNLRKWLRKVLFVLSGEWFWELYTDENRQAKEILAWKATF
jgi:IS5 family transposase